MNMQKRAVSVATQTTERKAPWTDIRTSAGYKRTFKSPSMNNEDLPCPRPPASRNLSQLIRELVQSVVKQVQDYWIKVPLSVA